MTESQVTPTQLLMVREDLSTLPPTSIPQGCTLSSYHPGDESAWEHIIDEAFQGKHNFTEFMMNDEPYLPERVWFLRSGPTPAATASAWYRPEWGEDTGYLHMVGALASHAGKGFGLQVSLAALHRMREEGRTRAVLNTDDFRLSAIVIYLKLGFVPVLAAADHGQRWIAIAEATGMDCTPAKDRTCE
ncbi:MAG: GNAT family N-acetyltransferase [Gorillibacterium sp.]|nr:GNAT family N-acetyltransferase [Gorillibacterium sp.]